MQANGLATMLQAKLPMQLTVCVQNHSLLHLLWP